MSSGRSFLSVGSPPVRRTRVTPQAVNTRARRVSSRVLSSSARGVSGTPPAGMQYPPAPQHITTDNIATENASYYTYKREFCQ